MSILKNQKRKIFSSKTLGKQNMYRRKTPQNKLVLKDFIGKFQAKNQINCVDLKRDFKNGGV